MVLYTRLFKYHVIDVFQRDPSTMLFPVCMNVNVCYIYKKIPKLQFKKTSTML